MKVRAYFAVLVYILAANVPLWLASRCLGFSVGGLFNIEFVAVGILALYLPRVLRASLLLGAILLDLFYCIGRSYMLSPGELVESASSALLFVPSHLWSIAAITIAAVAVCLLTVIEVGEAEGWRERRHTAAVLAGCALLGVAIDSCRGEVAAFHTDSQQGQYRLVRNTLHRLFTDEMRLAGERRRPLYGKGMAMAGASLKFMDLHPAAALDADWSARPNVVFVVVESWGKPLSTEIDQSLLRLYMRPEVEASYTVSTGTVPFYGATVSGELRELCGSSLGLAVMSAPASRLTGCLPQRFERMGYHTTAVHGFAGAMFERNSWYRKVHFEETWFQAQLKQKGLPECPGPFPGICDAAVANWIGGRLQEDAKEPQFLYWLTLNSHLPVPLTDGVKDPPSCAGTSALADDAICAWYRLIFNVHRSVSELAMRRPARPTAFIIVGDHSPPFSSEQRRAEFSGSVVPYVLLWPKSLDHHSPVAASSVAALPPSGHSSPPLPHGHRSSAKAHAGGT